LRCTLHPMPRNSSPASPLSSTADSRYRGDTNMKLLRYGPPGAEKPGLLDRDGTIRCLAAVVRDIDGFALSDAAVRMIASIDANTLPKVDPNVRLGACVARPVNYVCIGLNYADHAAEAGMPVPKE